jgi:hypothetical protein
VIIVSSGADQLGNDKIDDLINLMDIDPDALREAEFVQAQSILDTLVGKTIRQASMEATRIVVETTEGDRYFFYGFMGGSSTSETP